MMNDQTNLNPEGVTSMVAQKKTLDTPTSPGPRAFDHVTRSPEARDEDITRFMHRLFDGISGERNYIRVSHYSHSGYAYNADHPAFGRVDPQTKNIVFGNQLNKRLMFDNLDNAINYVKEHRDQDMYVASTTFLSATNAKSTNVSQRKWIVAEFDAKTETDDVLDLVPFEPTLIVRSSRVVKDGQVTDIDRLHLYWELDQSYTDADDLERINQINNDFVDSIPELDCVKDASRILRIPGTLHCKDQNQFWDVEFIRDTGNVYTLDQWAAAYPASAAKKRKKSTAQRSPQQKITSGDATPSVKAVLNEVQHRLDNGEQCHGTMLFGQMRLVSLGDAGHDGVEGALNQLHDMIENEVNSRGERATPFDEKEWDDGLRGAMEMASADESMLAVSPQQVIFPTPNEFDAVAEQISRKYLDGYGNKTLIRMGQSWYRYNGTNWEEVLDEAVHSIIRTEMRHAVYLKRDNDGNLVSVRWVMSLTNIGNIRAALEHTQFEGSRSMNAATPLNTWIGNGQGSHVEVLVAVKNGLLDPIGRKLYPFSAGFFNMSVNDTVFDPTATECPNWDYLIDSQWKNDPQSAQTLHEFMGYAFVGDSWAQKGLFLSGAPRGGKGTIDRTLQSMIGSEAIASLSFDDLSDSFGLAEAVGAKLIVFSDASTESARDHTAVERIKKIIGNDRISVNRKNQKRWTGPLGNVLLVSNGIPKFRDSSGAAAKRFVVIHAPVSFLGKEDPELEDRIRDERSAILNRILDAYQDLRKRKRFLQPESAGDIVHEMSQTTGLKTFIDEYCIVDEDAWVTKEEFADAYSLYCSFQNMSAPIKGNISKELTPIMGNLVQKGPGVKKSVNGKRVYVYKGIALKVDPKDGASTSGYAFSNSGTFHDRLSASVNTANNGIPEGFVFDTSIPDEAPKVAATDDSAKPLEKPVEAPSKETRTLTLEDGRKVVCEDLTGGWNPDSGQFRVTVYTADGSVAGAESASGAFLRQHRDVDVTAFTE